MRSRLAPVCLSTLLLLGLLGAPAALSAPPPDADRGVALADLGDDAAAIDRCLRRGRDRALRDVVAVALVERRAGVLVVDVLGRDPRFAGFNRRSGGLGVARVELPPTVAKGACDPARRVIARETAVSDMSLKLHISLTDLAAVIDDEAGDFRRVFPVGIGAVDRVRVPGALSSLTPATELARLDRRNSRRSVDTPRYYRGLPYIPLNIARVTRREDGTPRHMYGKTRVAFHAHMGRRFVRGYTSHGCVTMRDAELRELADILWAVEDTLPLVIRAEPLADAGHPLPVGDAYYYELVNHGTAEAPEYRLKGSMYHIEKRQGLPPDPVDLVGRFMDREAPAHRPVIGGGDFDSAATAPSR